MSKKDFKNALSENNPALNFISGATVELEHTEKTPAGEVETTTTKQVKKADAVIKETKQKARETETRSKRLNLLIPPSLHKDLSKIATMNKDSINNLIIEVLTTYRDNNKNIIEKYNKVFED